VSSGPGLSRAIVTGGAGFIGSHLADFLVAMDTRVLILDNFYTGRASNVQSALAGGAELVDMDIHCEQDLNRIVASFRPDAIFHFAAQVDVRHSALHPATDARSNVIGSVNVLAAAAEHKVRRVVFASTGGAIYGDAASVPTAETEPTKPISPYGLSKLSAEMYAQWFRESRHLDVVTLRFGNVYGPRQDPARGAVIARFCEQAVRGAEFEIFGTGKATRDYLYVGDAVAASFQAAQRDRLRYCVYNVSSGEETSVRELASVVAGLAGHADDNLNVVLLETRPGEVSRSCLDISRARDDGIVGALTPLDVGITATLAWMRTSHVSPLEEPATPVLALEEPGGHVLPLEEPAPHVLPIEEPPTPVLAPEEPAAHVTSLEEPALNVLALEEPAAPVLPLEKPAAL
jgi:UDP-glucose 4-epimerase